MARHRKNQEQEMIHSEIHNDIAVLRMEHGKVNAIDIEFIYELNERLDDVASSSVRSLILTGSGNAFSAGVDLFRILKEDSGYIERFLPLMSDVFEKLFVFPKPVIAATNGHAIAGGCILHCSCDYRLMANGNGRIGVPELMVGVPFPTVPLEILRFATPAPFLQQLVYTGATFSASESLQRGLTDEVVAPEHLMERAQEMATMLGSIVGKSFSVVKEMLRRPAMNRAKSARNQEEILEAWISPEIHAVIRDYLDKTIGKKK